MSYSGNNNIDGNRIAGAIIVLLCVIGIVLLQTIHYTRFDVLWFSAPVCVLLIWYIIGGSSLRQRVDNWYQTWKEIGGFAAFLVIIIIIVLIIVGVIFANEAMVDLARGLFDLF